ncbi:uncharacterized protein [Dysidea avara]|uniref:uncharacterized protein isoform X1 n=1 Tax=Dysidea avara TaxID=196820 RepID=UPI00332BA115
MYCESCDNVVIEGITWDRCGDPNGTNIAGLTFNITSNISLLYCTFQYSGITAVYLRGFTGILTIHHTNFTSNIIYEMRRVVDYGALFIGNSNVSDDLTINISDSKFDNNIYSNRAGIISVDISGHSLVVWIKDTIFLYNSWVAWFQNHLSVLKEIHLIGISVVNNGNGFAFSGSGLNRSNENVFFVVESSVFRKNLGNCLLWITPENSVRVMINNSSFTNNEFIIEMVLTVNMSINLTTVNITNNTVNGLQSSDAGVVAIYKTFSYGDVEVYMTNVIFKSNGNLKYHSPAVTLRVDSFFSLHITECEFIDNKSSGHGAALHVTTSSSTGEVKICNTSFDKNIADDSIAYFYVIPFSNLKVQVNNSNFTNNIGSSMYLSSSILHLIDNVLFENNTADYGAAVYLDQGGVVLIDKQATVRFVNNIVSHNGGAIYINMIIPDCDNGFGYSFSDSSSVVFINNSAVLVGNSLYFNIPKSCKIKPTLLSIPCHFKYYQLVNKTNVSIQCNASYTSLNGTGSPIVTSPHELRLYFPNSDGVNISSNSDHNIYYIKNNILGHDVKFNGVLLDFFEKKAAPSLFNIKCIDCSNVHVSLLSEHILIDNITSLSVKFMGANETNINVTLNLNLTSYSRPKVSTTLKVELVPCSHHPGNVYSKVTQTCVCYHHDVVECYDTYNEIRRGYWFGSVGGTPTTSLCPNHYCKFRKETRQGYFELPETVNTQCKRNRSGTACGNCNSNCTLTYDSTDCISVDHCSTGMTVLVVVLTCLYWIVVVVGVFSLMYFNFQISSGYVYGIIYYYSMVGILLSVNTNISDETYQLVRILSSFANLTPEFLGQLCFVTGLSGIDQLFIHYSHAVAVSILTLVIVLAARCSVRITVLVSRCIIRVICLLLLLSYTSLTSTSLQLLRPLKFTDVNEVYTYASPHIGYFHGRHAIYGIVAVICELVVGIGLPLLLLLEPLLSRKINFIKIKPLLDQFQGCYKTKYRWFAAYYLICRQVIMLIVFVGNSNYYNMLFYLQTTLVVIALIHMWAQPYKDKILNLFDGLLLNIMSVIANINIYTLLQSVAPGITIALLVLPLFLCCLAGIKLATHRFVRYFKKSNEYQPLDDLITANPA